MTGKLTLLPPCPLLCMCSWMSAWFSLHAAPVPAVTGSCNNRSATALIIAAEDSVDLMLMLIFHFSCSWLFSTWCDSDVASFFLSARNKIIDTVEWFRWIPTALYLVARAKINCCYVAACIDRFYGNHVGEMCFWYYSLFSHLITAGGGRGGEGYSSQRNVRSTAILSLDPLEFARNASAQAATMQLIIH